MIFIKNLSMLLLTLLTIFDISFMETISEDTCDAEDQVLAQLFVKLENYVDRSQNNTQQITELHEQFRVMEQKIDDTQKRLEKNQKTMEENQRILLEIQKIVLSNKNNTQQITTELHEQLRVMQQKMNETQKRLEENQKTIEKNQIIIIQRRTDGSEDFYRTWNEYKNGFGKIDGEFFIGLEKVYELTNSDRYELIITMEDFENNRRHASYDNFVIGSETEKYVLKSLGNYNGTEGDSFNSDSIGNKFTTKDQDNDKWDGGNCANYRHGAWWYVNCSNSNLNGKYSKDANVLNRENIFWHSFQTWYALKFVEMKLRKFHT